MKKYLIATCIIILMASSSFSFDGNRKGFVLGGGLGFSPNADWEVDGLSAISESGSGVGVNLLIGYAFDEKNFIAYDGNVVGYKSDALDVDLFQGYYGASWYHYFGDIGKSMFSVVGVGTYAFEADGFDANDRGGAIMLGGGYEFSKHWQIGIYFSSGKTSDPFFDYNHTHVNVLISGIAF